MRTHLPGVQGRDGLEREVLVVRCRATICGDNTLEKRRFFVEDAGATWHVDIYGGILNGVVIAEIELKQETQALTLPSWVGKEVTDDPFYKKINMRARALDGRSLLT
jgi:adenylate cyclase